MTDHNTPTNAGGARGLLDPPESQTRWARREHLRTLEAIVYQGWDVPPEAMQQLPIELHRIAADAAQSTRDRIRATEALAHLMQQRADAAVQLDRILRLDAGQATDRVEVLDSLTDAQIAAVAASVGVPTAQTLKDTLAVPSPPKPRRSRKRRP